MAMSFLSRDVLCAPIDLYYFVWAPLNSACHNFKASINLDPDSAEKRIRQVAYESLSFPEQVVSSLAHFVVRVGVGVSLSIPIINILPFGCLVIKAKEFVAPGMNEDLNLAKTQLETALREAQMEREKKPQQTEKSPKTEVKTSVQPEVKAPKPVLKRHTTPLNKPVNTTPTYPTPKAEDKEKNFIPTERTPFKDGLRDGDSLQRRASGPRVEAMKNRFQNNQDGVLPRKNSTPIIFDSEAARIEKEMEDFVVVNYFNLFPENSEYALLRKKQDKSGPLNAEKAIINNLILNFPGHIKQDKFINAQTNLKCLRDYLVQCLGEKEGNSWIRETYSNDAQVQTKDNPFEIVRKGIFSCPSNDFLNLIRQFEFVFVVDCIEVR